jgi:CRP-like cAMP-binding protein
MPPAALLDHAIGTLRSPQSERTQERVHLLAMLLTDHLHAFSSKLQYNQLCDVCRALSYTFVPPRVRMNDADESGQLTFRVLLTGSVLVQRRFGPKAWLPVGFLRPGDTLGLPAMLESSPDDIRYTTLSDAAEFAVLRRFEFERCLRSLYEKDIAANVALLQSTPSFASLPEATLKQLVSCSRLVTLSPGELLTREGDATDEMFVLKNGAVRLVKSLKTTEKFRWPTDKTPEEGTSCKQSKSSGAEEDILSSVKFTRAPTLRSEARETLDTALNSAMEAPHMLLARARGGAQAPAYMPLPPPEAGGRRGSVRRGSVRDGGRRGSVRDMDRVAPGDRRGSVSDRRGSVRRMSVRQPSQMPNLLESKVTFEGDEDNEATAADEQSSHFREVAGIHRNRIVVVGDVRESCAFAYDEAISVMYAMARIHHRSPYQPPLRLFPARLLSPRPPPMTLLLIIKSNSTPCDVPLQPPHSRCKGGADDIDCLQGATAYPPDCDCVLHDGGAGHRHLSNYADRLCRP